MYYVFCTSKSSIHCQVFEKCMIVSSLYIFNDKFQNKKKLYICGEIRFDSCLETTGTWPVGKPMAHSLATFYCNAIHCLPLIVLYWSLRRSNSYK